MDEFERIGRTRLAVAQTGEYVGHQRDLAGGVHLRRQRDLLLPIGLVQREAVIAGPVRVGQRHRGAAGRQGQREMCAFADPAGARRAVHRADGDAPTALRGGEAERRIGRLREVQRRRRAAQRGLQQRHAGAVDEIAECRHDFGMPRGRGDGADEVARRRIAARVFREIGMDAALPVRRPHIGLEHAQHRRALVVGDGIEGVFEIVGIGDRLVDLPRRGQLVEVHHVEAGAQRVGGEIHLRQHGGGRLVFRPIGEGFVEPGVVPPGGRHEIAEPLMRQLMRLHRQAAALLVERRIGIEQQVALAEGDRAGVLHRARREVRHRQDVELLERIADAEISLERGDDLGRQRQRIGDALAVAARRDAADVQRTRAIGVGRRGAAVDDVERAHRQGDQIGRQGLGRLEHRVDHAVRGGRGGDDRRVADDPHALGRDHGHVERRLEAGLVERREGAARIGRFELGEGVGIAAVDDLVEPRKRAIERRVVIEDQRRLAGRHLVDEDQPRHAGRIDLVVMRRETLSPI